MRYMRIIDVDQKIRARIYNEEKKAWMEREMSIEAFLNRTVRDMIPVIEVECEEVTDIKGERRPISIKVIERSV